MVLMLVDRHMEGDLDFENYNKSPLISALNLVLQEHAQKTGFRVGQQDIRVGQRYFFSASSGHKALSPGIEAWRGFFVSVRPMYKQLMVNVNVCMTAFFTPGNLATAMKEFERQTGDYMPKAFVQKVKVATTHLGYTRKKAILRITNQLPSEARFECQELGGMVTVEEYFSRSEPIPRVAQQSLLNLLQSIISNSTTEICP